MDLYDPIDYRFVICLTNAIALIITNLIQIFISLLSVKQDPTKFTLEGNINYKLNTMYPIRKLSFLQNWRKLTATDSKMLLSKTASRELLSNSKRHLLLPHREVIY